MATENRGPDPDRTLERQDPSPDLSEKEHHLEHLRHAVEETKVLYDKAAVNVARAEKSGDRNWLLSARLTQGALMLVYSQALTEFTRYLLDNL